MIVPIAPENSPAAPAGGGKGRPQGPPKAAVERLRPNKMPIPANPEEQHRMLKEREYCSVHEENQTQRQVVKDQQKIIDQQKVEIQRLTKELMAKARDLNWTQELYDRLKNVQEAERAKVAREREQVRLEEMSARASSPVERVRELEQGVAHKAGTIEALKYELSEAHSLGQRRQEELSDLKKEFALADSELRTLRRQMKELQDEFEDKLYDGTKEVKRQLQEALKLAEEERTEINILSKENGRLKEQIDDLRVKIQWADDDKTELAQRAEVLKHESNDRLQQAREMYESRSNELERQLVQAQAELKHVEATLVPQVGSLRAQIEMFREQQELTDRVQKAKIKELEGQKEYFEERMHRFEREKTIIETERQEQLKEQARKFQQQLDEKETLFDEERSKGEKLARQLSTALADKAAAEKLEAETQEKLKAQEESNRELSQKLAASEKEIEDLNADLEDQIAAYTAEKERNGPEDEEFAALEEERDRLADELKESQQALEEAEEDLDEMEAEIEELKKANQEGLPTAADPSIANAAIAQAQEETQQWRQRCDALEVELEDTRQDLEEEVQAAQVAHGKETETLKEKIAEQEKQLQEKDHSKQEEIVRMQKAVQEAEAKVEEEAKGKDQYAKALKEAALKEAHERFERERKRLMDKLKLAEVQQQELEKSLANRTNALGQEGAERRKTAKEISDRWAGKQKDWEQLEAKLREEAAGLGEKAEEERKRADDQSSTNRELQRRLAELEQEIDRMRQVQLHW